VCAYMTTALTRLVTTLETAPETKAGDIDIIPPDERHKILSGWNASGTQFANACIHTLFEQQVAKTPHAIAVTSGTLQLTYAALNKRANQLARYLRSLGVKPDAHVVICLDRGFAMIEAMLAVLKAGGAYVPLDPNYPQERLSYMIEDS